MSYKWNGLEDLLKEMSNTYLSDKVLCEPSTLTIKNQISDFKIYQNIHIILIGLAAFALFIS